MITEVKKTGSGKGFVVGKEVIETKTFNNYVKEQGKVFGIYEKEPLHEISDGYVSFDECFNSLSDFIGDDLIVCVYDFNIDRFLIETLRQDTIDYCSSLNEAKKTIEKLEAIDLKKGIYIEGFYRILDLLTYSS